MTWSTTKPTVPGWYWWRENGVVYMAGVTVKGPSTPYLAVALVDPEGGVIMRTILSDLTLAGQWAGPIPAPEE